MAVWSLRVPMVRALFEQVATPAKLGPLGLVDVLNWAEAALNRVDRTAFFAQFHEGQAVQYFYEPFLQAFDPELRKDLGVWFTPPEIVQYMVARVDTVLREELDIEDGLADPRVYVLDPCCGTGSYLVEVLHRIAATLKEKGGDALVAADLKRAAVERVFGFEILPAPFVVAHLQLGLLLDGLGSPLDEDHYERAAVFLTNALTGWEPPKGPKQHLVFPELEQERDAAEKVKRDTPILVILGNPPYNAFAGTSPEEERGLVEPYKAGLISEWGIKKFNLDDLYVRFFRLAERRIAEMTGQGVICYISNFSYLSDPSFVVMRKRFLQEFDRIWIDCMNGDSRETGKRTPDGRPDPSVFSTEQTRAGIRLGTTVGLFVRKQRRLVAPVVSYRDFWGVTKRVDLLKSIRAEAACPRPMPVTPSIETKFSFRPVNVANEYLTWPGIHELSRAHPFNGPVERRGMALISIDPEPLMARMRAYFDSAVSDEEVRQLHPSLMMTGNRIIGPDARKKLLRESSYDPSVIARYPFRPFDVRYCYLANIRPLFSEPSPELLRQRFEGNRFLVARESGDVEPTSPPFLFSSLVCDYHTLSMEARLIPLILRDPEPKGRGKGTLDFPVAPSSAVANISDAARRYLERLGASRCCGEQALSSALWSHVLAQGYSPAYLAENRDGIRQDWPRIPLPNTRQLLESSAALGRQVAGLLDTESGVKGVTAGKVRTELRAIGVMSRVGGGSLNPAAGDLAVTAGWGHAGKGGVTMPGKGKAEERPYTAEELAAMEAGAAELGLSREQAIKCLGKRTFDIYLNGVAYWRNVPARVWGYTIGGYQVMKKWLSYREQGLLGRPLSLDEAHYVTEMARRLAALVLLEPALDASYEGVKAETYAWPGADEGA